MLPIVRLFDTDARPKILRADVLHFSWLESIHQRNMTDRRSASDKKLEIFWTITIHICMSESRSRVNFGVIDELIVPVLSGTTYIDWFVKSIHLAERKIMLHHYPSVPILMIRETRCEPEMNKPDFCHEVEKDLELLLTAIRCERMSITVARQVGLKAMIDTPVLVFRKPAGRTEVTCRGIMARKMPVRRLMKSWTLTWTAILKFPSQILARLMETCTSTKTSVMSQMCHRI